MTHQIVVGFPLNVGTLVRYGVPEAGDCENLFPIICKMAEGLQIFNI